MTIVIRSNPLSGVTVLGVHPFTIEQVERYVSNILSKLHLEDRTQVAVFAWQQGLMERG
jgi:hypothetical protein